MTLPAAHTHLENTRQHLLRLAAQHQQARAAGTEAGGRREGGGWRGCSVLLRAAARPTQQGCQGSRLAWHHPRPAQPACPVGAPPAPPPVCRRLCKLPHLASRSARLSSKNCTRFTPILQHHKKAWAHSWAAAACQLLDGRSALGHHASTSAQAATATQPPEPPGTIPSSAQQRAARCCLTCQAAGTRGPK